ncbi:MAG: GNAT family N-acetyltransferase, partial [Nanoarchaeota archaeon]
LKHRLELAFVSRFRKLPLSTLDDVIDVVSPGLLKDNIDICYHFNAFRNRFGHLESRRAEMTIAYNRTARELSICNIDVYGEHRGKGYGRLLVRATEDAAIALAARKVVAINSTNNTFWEHMGYTLIDEDDCPTYERMIFF